MFHMQQSSPVVTSSQKEHTQISCPIQKPFNIFQFLILLMGLHKNRQLRLQQG